MKSHLLCNIVLLHYLTLFDTMNLDSDNTEYLVTENGAVNERPIIGILTRENYNSEHGDEFVDASYVRYLQMAGARVVPVRPKRGGQYYEKLFNSINGVFLPGGAASPINSTYRASGEIMFKLAIEANKRGDYFPIWGTCLGFELMLMLICDELSFRLTPTQNTTLPLKFTAGYDKSRLFQDIPNHLMRYSSTEKVSHNNHKWSTMLETYENLSSINNFYQVLTTTEHEGEEFVSTIEAYDYPFYGVQWHPERSIFHWSQNLTVNHSYHSIKLTHYLADFFVNEARKNFHRFDSIKEEAHAVIENAKRVFLPNFKFGERFYFNYTDDSKY